MRKLSKRNRRVAARAEQGRPFQEQDIQFSGLDSLETRLLMSTTEDLKLIASGAKAGDQYGQSISVDGDFAIVGAPGRDTAAINGGAAFIYQRNGNSWTQVAVLTANDATNNDLFGSAVAISGDRVVVGASGDNAGAGVNSGSAYVFQRSGNTWSQVAKINASDAAAGDLFGSAVSISGGRAIIGAYQNDNGTNNTGAAYIFHENGGTWTQNTVITGLSTAFAEFGNSVDIDGDTAVIGSQGETNGTGSTAGAAYVYVFNGAAWVQQQKLMASDQAAFDQFGSGVAIDGNRIVVGAQGNDDGGASSGSAYVFDRSGNSWSETAKLIAPDDAAGDLFGRSVDVLGDNVVVGAFENNSTSNVFNTGSVYFFQKNGNTWTNKANYIASDAGAEDRLGQSVSLNDTFVFSGAAFNDTGSGADSGVAYVFNLNKSAPPTVLGEVNGAGLLTITGTSTGDTITLTAQGNGKVKVTGTGINKSFTGVNNITIDALGGNDIITVGPNIRDVAGNLINVVINGGDGNDQITGGDGNDVIDGGEGDDSITGGFGNDIINSGNGNDTAVGGGGSDTVDGVAAGPQVAVGVGGVKKVTYTDADGTVVTITAKSGLANISFSGTDIVMTNSKGNVTVTGTNLGVSNITLLNTSSKTSLSITTKGGDGLTDVSEITGSTPVGTVSASKVNLNGAGVVFTGTGTASSITINNLTNGADIVLPGANDKGVAIKVNQIDAGSDINVTGALKSISGVGALLGNMSAMYFGGISTKGNLGGTLTATSESSKGVSFSGITAASIANATVTGPGTLSSVKVQEWLEGAINVGNVGSLSVKANTSAGTSGNFGADMNLNDATQSTSLKSASISGALDDATWTFAAPSGTITAGSIGSDFSLTAANLGKVTSKSTLGGSYTATGETTKGVSFAGITARSIANATVNGPGTLSSISVQEWLDGVINVGNVGSLSSKGSASAGTTGNFGADMNLSDATQSTSLKSASISGALDNATWIFAAPSGSITAGSVGDNFSLDVEGALAGLTVKGDVAGDFAADMFSKVSVTGNLNAARFLAGADFGADGTLNGVNDTFGQGSIGSFSVNGTVNDSVIGAGLDPVDGVFKNGNDVVTGGLLAEIKSLNLKGLVNDGSLIAAGKFPTTVKIANVTVDPTTDPRFLVG